METDKILRGDKITLISCTNALWHEFYKKYVPDPMMDDTAYTYDFARAEEAWLTKSADAAREYFSIIQGEDVIGEICLKHMDRQRGTTEFGVALIDDTVKGRGFGSEAVRLFVGYAFDVLGFDRILADSVLRNARSQHVLEKAGFVYTHEDSVFKYYRLEKKT